MSRLRRAALAAALARTIVGHIARGPMARSTAREFGPAQARHGPVAVGPVPARHDCWAVPGPIAGHAGTAAVSAKLCGISVLFSIPRPEAGATAPTRGHLGLIRAHPGLRDLNAALAGSSSRDAFFLDAAHALAACALRTPTMTGRVLRGFTGQPKNLAAAANLDTGGIYGLELALLQARDGRFDEALAGTGTEWLKSLPKLADGLALEFAFEMVFAMPGSSPPSTQGAVDKMNFDRGGWSMIDRFNVSLLLAALRCFASKYARFPCERYTRSTPPPPPPSGGRAMRSVNLYSMLLVECSQAMLASLLRARPLCGERLREARATAERALADVEAEGDDLAAVDVNLLLAFLAARDGDFDDALRRYKAAVQKDPSDSRPYELAAMLCFVTGQVAESEAWRRDGRAALPVAELVVAAALGDGTLTALGLGRGGQGRLVLVAAWREVDARLATAVQDDDLTLSERVQLRLLRRLLRQDAAIAEHCQPWTKKFNA
uniref:Uncharacterized protein n=1 Tax=Oryza punctata TaxID=4537 RepID=A0A0E0JJR5_ORYPU